MTSLTNFPDICCKKYYKNQQFDNLCSLCFKKKNPEKWQELIGQFIKINPDYPTNYLEELTTNRSLPNNHPCYQMLKFLCKNASINEKDNYLSMLKVINDTTEYKGWTSKQAEELTGIFINKFCDDNWKEMKTGGKYWRIQHMICGGVVDWWNLDPNKVGGIGYCYYSNFGEKPKMYCKNNPDRQYRVPLPPAFRNKKYGTHLEKNQFIMWLKSVIIK
jgi:hypothetical protein